MMKKKIFIMTVCAAFAFSFTFAFAKNHTAEERGNAHFNNPAFAGGKKPCSTCHANGRGLKDAGTKTDFSIMGSKQANLEEVVNVCIVNANKGTPLDVGSTEMQELVSYIKSFGAKTAPGYGK
jgi:cytochrome c